MTSETTDDQPLRRAWSECDYSERFMDDGGTSSRISIPPNDESEFEFDRRKLALQSRFMRDLQDEEPVINSFSPKAGIEHFPPPTRAWPERRFVRDPGSPQWATRYPPTSALTPSFNTSDLHMFEHGGPYDLFSGPRTTTLAAPFSSQYERPRTAPSQDKNKKRPTVEDHFPASRDFHDPFREKNPPSFQMSNVFFDNLDSSRPHSDQHSSRTPYDSYSPPRHEFHSISSRTPPFRSSCFSQNTQQDAVHVQDSISSRTPPLGYDVTDRTQPSISSRTPFDTLTSCAQDVSPSSTRTPPLPFDALTHPSLSSRTPPLERIPPLSFNPTQPSRIPPLSLDSLRPSPNHQVRRSLSSRTPHESDEVLQKKISERAMYFRNHRDSVGYSSDESENTRVGWTVARRFPPQFNEGVK